MDWHGLKRDWRIWLLILSLLVSFALIVNPLDPYTRDDDGDIRLKTNIKQGLDLKGGARVMIRPQPDDNRTVDQETISQIKQTLQTRISAFGLQEMDIRSVQTGGETLIQIELAGSNTQDLTELINRTGRFQATIPITVSDGEQLTLGDRTYNVTLDDRLRIDGEAYRVNDTFRLGSGGDRTIPLTYTNRSEGQARLAALAFTGQDILAVDTNARVSGVSRTRNGYRFRFQVNVDDTAARRVHDILQAFPDAPQNGDIPGARLVLTLDDERISSLTIAGGFQDTLFRQPIITGGAPSREQAAADFQELKSVLQSGALPVPIEIVTSTTVSATLGSAFLQSAILAIIAAIIAVGLLVYVRYRDPRIVLPLTMTGFSELVMILGFAAWAGWTIDLPSIAGIIAAVGTGVDDQIIITDERGRRSLQSLKERFKRAFFIIFTSAASTIGAMLPLMKIGAGTISGFALTTIVGVIIGVSITRPAYARLLQYMDA